MSSSASSAVRENASGVLYDLLTDSSGAGLLEKAVFSKCRDRAVVRIVLTLRLVRNNVVLQAETFRQAEVAAVSGKAKPVQAGQENLPLDSPSGQTRDRLTGLIAACDQINLITTAGSAEFRRSRNGAEILLGAAKVRAALDAAQLPGGSAPPKNRHCRTRSGQTAHSDRCRAVSHPFGSQRRKRSCSRQETAEIPPNQPFSGTDPGYGICLTRHGMPAYLRPVLWEKLPLLRRIPLFHRYPAPGGAHGGRGHEGGRHGCLQ